MSPRLLDLFSGSGGAATGYALAGFEVLGVDNVERPDYPFPILLADAVDVLADREFVAGFDVVHASPPCPLFSAITKPANRESHRNLLAPVFELLDDAPVAAWIVENVPRAPMRSPLLLCGATFGLGATCRDGRYRPLRRHRLFDSNLPLMGPGCGCDFREPIGVYGNGGGGSTPRPDVGTRRGYKAFPEEARAALETPWIHGRRDLADAIPPAYTAYLGRQVLDLLPEMRNDPGPVGPRSSSSSF